MQLDGWDTFREGVALGYGNIEGQEQVRGGLLFLFSL